MDTSARYTRNIGPLTPEENMQLRKQRVCVVGCGGLGGYVIEFLGRIGVGYITAVDGDCFDHTNLNRQLLCTEETVGESKAIAAKARMAVVNPTVYVEAVACFLTEENAVSLLANHSLVIDALDHIPERLLLQRVCSQLGIPLIHGAVDGWFAQICTVLPGEDSLSRVYPGITETDRKSDIPAVGVPSFVPSFAASLQVSEAIKVLLGREELIHGRILFADLLTNHFDMMPI